MFNATTNFVECIFIEVTLNDFITINNRTIGSFIKNIQIVL
ncbi:Uncharacterised protein [Klebsiella pneumoniae]|nr:Uncharacterised protein [Klebsiella pneumoniae]